MKRGSLLVLFAALAASAGQGVARGDEPAAKPSLRESWLADLPTAVSVPLQNGASFVVGLPAHLWIQCPRNGPGPTTFAGDGVVLQDIIDMGSGNSHSLAYLGAVPLEKPVRGESFDERFDRFTQFFAADLGKSYARVEFSVATPPEELKIERAEIAVDGKPTPAWRTSKYRTKPTGYATKPNEFLTGEAAFVGDEASNSLLYLVSDSKMRSLTLDQLLGYLSIRKAGAPGPEARRVQLLDIAAGRDANYPVRLAVYEGPAGFAPTLVTVRLREELVYAEDRADAEGRVTATWRIAHRDRTPKKSFEADVEKERALRGKAASAAKAVDLGTKGAQALVFTSKATVGDRPAFSTTAVVDFEDKVWSMTWTTFGDAAAIKADQAAFEALLHGLQLATR